MYISFVFLLDSWVRGKGEMSKVGGAGFRGFLMRLLLGGFCSGYCCCVIGVWGGEVLGFGILLFNVMS